VCLWLGNRNGFLSPLPPWFFCARVPQGERHAGLLFPIFSLKDFITSFSYCVLLRLPSPFEVWFCEPHFSGAVRAWVVFYPFFFALTYSERYGENLVSLRGRLCWCFSLCPYGATVRLRGVSILATSVRALPNALELCGKRPLLSSCFCLLPPTTYLPPSSEECAPRVVVFFCVVRHLLRMKLR